MADGQYATLLSRDQVAELLDVPFNTLAVWRHKRFVSDPSVKGATARQSRYSVDDAFSLYVFKLACEAGMRQQDAGTISRYLRHRPGTVETLYNYWPEPVTICVYPTHDLAAFNPPIQLLNDKAQRASKKLRTYWDERRAEISETGLDALSKIKSEIFRLFPVDELFAEVLHPSTGLGTWLLSADEIRELETQSDPEWHGTNVRAQWATTVYRNAKRVQYGSSTRYRIHLGGLDLADLSGMTTEDLLAAEAWAVEWIDNPLVFYGLDGPPGSDGPPHWRVDVSPALDTVIKAYGAPTEPPRELLPLQDLPDFA